MNKIIRTFILLLLITLTAQTSFPQSVQLSENESPDSTKLNRRRGLDMLDEIKNLIRKNYYDKNFKNIDLDERFDQAAKKVKTLDYNWQIFRVIAQVALDFDDSHTRFYPPGRANRPEYGFTMQMIGNQCFITDVKKGSDAEKKGLKPGDKVSRIDQYFPTREDLWKINYIYYSLDPKEKLKIFILDENGREKEIEIETKFISIKEREEEARKKRKKKKEDPYKCKEVNAELIACRLETFSVETKQIDSMMKEIGDHEKLILDLRGNRGGYVKIEEYLTGHFFEKDIKIANFVMRNETKERIAKTRKNKVYKGELLVLIDSNSASASEVFSYIIQIKKRGKIIGDVSAGAVMTSLQFQNASVRGVPGFETYSVYGMNLTIADLIMTDGKRLEKVGVIPDVLIGPTSYALLNQTDPVLAYSAKLFGANISDKEAADYYFLKPESEDQEDEETDADDSKTNLFFWFR